MVTYQSSLTNHVPSGQPVNNEWKHNNSSYYNCYVTM